MSTEGGTRAVIAAMFANLTIAVLKFVAWLLTGAASMLAEAIHSVADTSNQILLLIGGKQAKREADDLHPFGYGRQRYVMAFLVAIILFSMGGLFALYEAFHKYEEWHAGHPDALLESRWKWVPIVVLVGAIIAESRSLWVAVHEARTAKGKQSWPRFIRSAKAPELPVILLEDVAALLGLTFALAGVGLSLITHNGIFDVIGSALIGLLLVAVAVILAIETQSLLLGEGASPEAITRIQKAIAKNPALQLIHMKTLHLGPEELLVAVKVGVNEVDTAAEVARLINQTERAIREAEPMVTALYIEPDIYKPDRPADPSVLPPKQEV